MATIKNTGMITKKAALSFIENDASFIAGTLAYNALLAIFPFIIFLMSLTGFYGDTDMVKKAIITLLDYTPSEVANVLLPVIQEVTQIKEGALLTFGLLGTLWVLVSGVDALRLGLNKAYRVSEKRPFLKRKLQSLIFVFALALGLLMLSIMIVLGPLLFQAALTWFHASPQWQILWNAFRYGAALLILVALLSAIYYFLPNTQYSWRKVLPGALVSTFLWLLLASLFSLYLSHANNYSITYGSLSGIIISMLFFQLSASIFLFGAEINYASLATDSPEDSGEAPYPFSSPAGE